jgi:hypothetical protein
MLHFILLSIIFVLQIWFFVRSLQLINTIKKLYPDENNLAFVEEIYISFQQEIAIPKQYSLDFHVIVEKTRKYLLLNSSKEVNFFVVKDISEIQADELENRTDAGLSVPLYVGLMGTFLGIGLGLFQLNDFTQTGINNLIFGVIVAMAGSFLGLLFTVILNHLFRDAKEIADKNQRNYYQLVEEKLLNLFTNDDHKIKRLEEAVSNFATNLNQFNKDFNSGFTKNTEDFSKNLKNLDKVSDNIKAQRELLDRIEEINPVEMAQKSVVIFEKVNQSADMFQQFMGYQKTLNEMLLHSHTTYAGMQEQSKQITEALHTLLNRFSGFENGANQIGTYLTTNLQNMEEQVARINQHLQQNEKVFVSIKENSQKIDDTVAADAKERLSKIRKHFQEQGEQIHNQTEQSKKFYDEHIESMRLNFQIQQEQIHNQTKQSEQFYQNQNDQMAILFTTLQNKLSEEELFKQYLSKVNPLQKDIENQSNAINEMKQLVTQQQEKLAVQITEVVAKEMNNKQISMEIPKYVKPILFLVGGAAIFVIIVGILLVGGMVINIFK